MHARTHGRTDARMHGRTHAMADAESTTRREITLFLYPLKQHINYFITSPPPPRVSDSPHGHMALRLTRITDSDKAA